MLVQFPVVCISQMPHRLYGNYIFLKTKGSRLFFYPLTASGHTRPLQASNKYCLHHGCVRLGTDSRFAAEPFPAHLAMGGSPPAELQAPVGLRALQRKHDLRTSLLTACSLAFCRVGAMFFLTTNQCFSSISAIELFVVEKKIFM